MTALLLKYWYAFVIALLLAAIGVQQARGADAEAVLAEPQLAAETLRADREQAAREHRDKLDEVRSTHAASVKEKDDEFSTTIADLEGKRAAALADARSLRQQLAAATARGRPRTETGPAACERDGHRLEALGELAGEGAELLVEAQGLLNRRDAEVKRLLDQIAADRAAIEKAAAIQAFVR